MIQTSVVMIDEYNDKLPGYQTMLISRFMELVVYFYECGFNDSNYFTRQFTKTYGFSPKAYRLHR